MRRTPLITEQLQGVGIILVGFALFWVALASCGPTNTTREAGIAILGLKPPDETGCPVLYLGKENGANVLSIEWTYLRHECGWSVP